MTDPSPDMDAAVRGESDLNAVRRAPDGAGQARGIALQPNVHPLERAVSAPHGNPHELLDPPTIADPALHDAVARLIGTPVGNDALLARAKVALVGWGRAHAKALIDAAHRGMCAPGVAAALIGPCDESAGLLHDPDETAFAIRCWGQSDDTAPSAWAGTLSPAERDRLIATALSSPSACASCLPWLPPDAVHTAGADIPVDAALDAFAVASPTARAQHAAILQTLIDRAQPTRHAARTRRMA